ncbi:MAG: hypothetical protein GOMPHAMPRED_008097 [Gomphillus americanus]|uniref:Uncharacterized protein n=1 Tax=Gomphillus americanus TaxID=1940652 RepID=A0A8H3F4J1_9LECA|nr:MAG: hypothetical protein GOMPHAMPRED_008097 [Gomphillus americanus]
MQIAAGAGNVEMLQLFTNLGADADPPFMEPEELTPLMTAVRNGASDSITFLLSQGASIDRIVSTEWGPRMAMHYVAERGDLKVLNILLQAGASFTATEFDMEEPRDLAVKCGHESIVIRLEAAARGELVDTRPGNAVHDVQGQQKRGGRVFSSVEDWNVTSSNTENEVTSPTADSRRVSLEEQAESAPSLKPVRKDQRLSIFSLRQSKGETSDSKHGRLQRFSALFSGRQRKE